MIICKRTGVACLLCLLLCGEIAIYLGNVYGTTKGGKDVTYYNISLQKKSI